MFLQTTRPSFAQTCDFQNTNRNIDPADRGKCHSCGDFGHIAHFYRSKPRSSGQNQNLSDPFNNHWQALHLATQDWYTQPMISAGQYQPQQMTYGQQPLPFGYQTPNISTFPEFLSATVLTVSPHYVPPISTSNDQKNGTKLIVQIPAST